MRPRCSTTNSRAVSPGGDVRYTGLANVPNDCSAGGAGGGGGGGGGGGPGTGGGGGFTVPVQAAITAMTNRNRTSLTMPPGIDPIHRAGARVAIAINDGGGSV